METTAHGGETETTGPLASAEAEAREATEEAALTEDPSPAAGGTVPDLESTSGPESEPGDPEAAATEGIDPGELARDLLDQIIQAMGVPATVTLQHQPDGSERLLVEGEEMGVVIGKHGSTINALQYLVGLIVHKRTGERVRLVIDAEGYRSRREQALKEMARTYAQRVKESGNEAVLDALQSYERRIIHNSLADDPDVFTYSEGEEPDRRVVISPRDPEVS